MEKVIACIDGSNHAYSVCDLSSWVNKVTNSKVALLHVAAPHSEIVSKSDLSGSIGLGTQNDLLEDLSEVDEMHGKLEQKKGQSILEHASKKLKSNDVKDHETVHLRGSLVETIFELESEADLIIMGKKGDSTNDHKIGSNIESVINSSTKPLLVATKNIGKMDNFVIAYDGSYEAFKTIEYVAHNSLLKNLQCHLVTFANDSEAKENFEEAHKYLEKSGIKTTTSFEENSNFQSEIDNYVKKNKIDLLVIGNKHESKIRSFILGSKTTAIIQDSSVPVLLLR